MEKMEKSEEIISWNKEVCFQQTNKQGLSIGTIFFDKFLSKPVKMTPPARHFK